MRSIDDTSGSTIKDANLHELIIGIGDGDEGNFPVEKLEAHQHNVAHMAISIFVFRHNKLLMQQRANTKYHSGGLWANTVCSHPRWNESVADCATRRLQDELGWMVPLKKFGQINYATKVGSLYENEQVHCFFGFYNTACNIDEFNRDEVSAVRWVAIDEVVAEIDAEPECFSAWFRIYMSEHLDMINDLVEAELR